MKDFPAIGTYEQAIFTLLLAAGLLALVHFAPKWWKSIEERPKTIPARIVEVLVTGSLGDRLTTVHRERITVRDVLAQAREHAAHQPFPLGWRVRATLGLMLVKYLHGGGALLRIETGYIAAIVLLVLPSESLASHGGKYKAGEESHRQGVGVAGLLLGIAATVQLLQAADPMSRVFWAGWVAHALILVRVVHLGLGNNSRKWSCVGWLLIAVSQFEVAELHGSVRWTLAIVTAISAVYAAVGAIKETVSGTGD